MFDSPLPLIILLLAASVFVVTLARRLGLPSILGYVTVGLALGPHAFGLFPESGTTHLLGELGVVFLLFTLGLEFSWPRMVAMRREVFGLGSLQVFGTTAVVALIARMFGLPWAQSIVLGGVVAMSSTVLIVQQTGRTRRAESHPWPAGLQRGAVPGHRRGALPGAGRGAGPGQRCLQRRGHRQPAGRRHRTGAGGAGRRTLAVASLAVRDREQSPARAVHAGGAAGGAGRGLGRSAGRVSRWRWAPFSPA